MLSGDRLNVVICGRSNGFICFHSTNRNPVISCHTTNRKPIISYHSTNYGHVILCHLLLHFASSFIVKRHEQRIGEELTNPQIEGLGVSVPQGWGK